MSLIGVVRSYDARRGFGFVTVMTQDDPHFQTDVFVHNTAIVVRGDGYRRLFPGEYVSLNVGKGKDDRDVCLDVTGVMGGPLLVENERYQYRYFPRKSREQKTEDADDTADATEEVVEGGTA